MDSSENSLVGKLRFAPEILARLGEELIPHADLGIVELVRNCYDAGAPSCSIMLSNVDDSTGIITVTDTGVGMTRSELDSGFLLIGRSLKTSSPRTSDNARRKVGEKGLGRLAGLRLGHRVEVTTRPQDEPGVEYRLLIDWDHVDRATSVDSVDFPVAVRATDAHHGTTVKIIGLRKRFDQQDVERLVRALFLLNDPFGVQHGEFLVTLDAPGYEEIAERLTSGYFDQADYRIEAEVDDHGKASAVVIDWRGAEIDRCTHEEIASRRDGSLFAAPAATFTLWVIRLSGESFKQRGSAVPTAEVRKWLQHVGGVHLYHRGLRVHPYGDKGHDWLDMNLSRTASPEERPSTNNSVGRFVVEGDDEILIQKTDRSGFIENEAFRELREFGRAVLDRVARERVRRRDADRERRRQETVDAVDKSEEELNDALDELPEESRRKVLEKAKAVTQSQRRRIEVLEEDLNLYRTLGTVGTAAAVFAHESITPVSTLQNQASIIEMNGKVAAPDDYEKKFGRGVERIRAAADSLMSSAQIPLRLVARSKREARLVSVNKAIEGLIDVLMPRVADRKIVVDLALTAEPDGIISTISSIEAIVANLIINATHALSGESGIPIDRRRIAVNTTARENQLEISIADSGPGIAGINLTDIWLPGQTTRNEGTGLGLTIVRDVVADLKGSANVFANGRLGGAEFKVLLPYPTAADLRKLRRTTRSGVPDDQEQLL